MIFGSAGVAESTYTDPAEGGIPPALDPRVLITAAPVQPSASSDLFAAFAASSVPSEPYATYGYEAMSLLLSAIDRATGHGRKQARRSAVVAAIFHTRGRRSVIGTYSIDRNGDTTLKTYGVYRVVGGQLEFWKAVDG
jgi:branched-chain amino acid transport system substrate-binding protein